MIEDRRRTAMGRMKKVRNPGDEVRGRKRPFNEPPPGYNKPLCNEYWGLFRVRDPNGREEKQKEAHDTNAMT
jgi:hypothetical protein